MKIITISREFGSGGRELGKRLANTRLGASGHPREAADLAAYLAVAQEPESF